MMPKGCKKPLLFTDCLPRLATETQLSRTCRAGAFLLPELDPVPKVQSPSSGTLRLPLPALPMKSALQKSLWQQNSSYSPKRMK